MYENILFIIDLDLIVGIVLFVIVFLYRRKFNMSDIKNKLYVSIVILTIFIIFLEILDKLVLQFNSNYMIPITKLINVLGFGLGPIVPYLWIKYLFNIYNIKVRRFITAIPVIVNLVISSLSYKFNLIFNVLEDNTYERGILFCIPILIMLIYLLISLCIVYKKNDVINKSLYNILLLFEIMPMIAVLLQAIFSELLLVWATVGISEIVHYIYLQERFNKYDNLTGLLNRGNFEAYVYNKFINKKKKFSLVYFDVNDFKIINDKYGHGEGDIALVNIANIISSTIENLGVVCRIGGDEFIAVFEDMDYSKINSRLKSINSNLYEKNKSLGKSYNLDVSIGCKSFSCEYDNLNDYIREIDRLMYIDKRSRKSQYDRVGS